MKSKLLPVVLSVIALVASLISLTRSPDASNSTSKEIVVTHGVVTPTATTGSGIGTIRTFNIPIAIDGMEADDQYLLGTLTTLEVGVNGDEELRSANLNFVLGGESNQVVLGGISLYPPAGATIAPGNETIRPNHWWVWPVRRCCWPSGVEKSGRRRMVAHSFDYVAVDFPIRVLQS